MQPGGTRALVICLLLCSLLSLVLTLATLVMGFTGAFSSPSDTSSSSTHLTAPMPDHLWLRGLTLENPAGSNLWLLSNETTRLILSSDGTLDSSVILQGASGGRSREQRSLRNGQGGGEEEEEEEEGQSP